MMTKKKYEKINNYLHNHPNKMKTIKWINKIGTIPAYVIYPSTLLILALSRDERFWRVLLVPGISFMLVSLFRKHVNYPRPYEKLDIVPIIEKDTKGKSFPSRHVFSAFVIAMTLYYIYAPIGIFLFIMGALLAFARVVGGVHFPIDVIVGAALGILIGATPTYFINIFFVKI